MLTCRCLCTARLAAFVIVYRLPMSLLCIALNSWYCWLILCPTGACLAWKWSRRRMAARRRPRSEGGLWTSVDWSWSMRQRAQVGQQRSSWLPLICRCGWLPFKLQQEILLCFVYVCVCTLLTPDKSGLSCIIVPKPDRFWVRAKPPK